MTSWYGIHVLHNVQACWGIWLNVKDGNQSSRQKMEDLSNMQNRN